MKSSKTDRCANTGPVLDDFKMEFSAKEKSTFHADRSIRLNRVTTPIEQMTTPVLSDPPILTVSQLSNAIKLCLEKTFPLVWLQGEIINCKSNASGHLYFSLKDANAQVSAVMFRGDAAALKIVPKDGTQVIVRGEINVYPISGKYQVIVRELRPVGLGELLLKLEELKIKLNKKGWFSKERKRPLPKFPKRIGVVTSPTGAVIQDIINILSRRFSGFHLVLNPVKVQGEGAAQEIAQAIEQFNTHDLADVLIIGRGGGSLEDLWAFNEEVVAEAIFNSRIPTISAVGHETDHCIADYVADVRAPTPSAAAELVIAEKSQQMAHLAQIRQRMQQTVYQLIRQDRHRLAGLLRHPVFLTPYAILGPWIQQMDLLRQDLDAAIDKRLTTQRLVLTSKQQLLTSLNPLVRLGHFKQKLLTLDRDIRASALRKVQTLQVSLKHAADVLERAWKSGDSRRQSLFQSLAKYRQLDMAWARILAQKQDRFKNIKDSLDAVNPKNLLTKGYCILFSEKDNSAITSVHSVEKKQQVQILLTDGNLKATINQIIAK